MSNPNTQLTVTGALRTDRRSPLARARDDFLQSEEGEECCDPTTLRASPDQRQYLENRIAAAFLAGVKAAEKLAKAGQLNG